MTDNEPPHSRGTTATPAGREPAVWEPLALSMVVPMVGSPAAEIAGELVAHVLAELPALGVLGERDRLLAAAWLAGLRSARTRRSYAGDLLGWTTWLTERGLEAPAAGRVHVDLWVRAQLALGAGDASVRRRLSGIGSFYRYCLTHGLVGADPTAGVTRPRVDPDYTATVGLTREQGRALIAAADADTGRSRLRSAR